MIDRDCWPTPNGPKSTRADPLMPANLGMRP